MIQSRSVLYSVAAFCMSFVTNTIFVIFGNYLCEFYKYGGYYPHFINAVSLIDTGVLYADQDLDASRHDAASNALESVYDGEFGEPYVSDYSYDDAVTLASSEIRHNWCKYQIISSRWF